jgi:NAD(P)-dependent dehydrogenase (short-subunit alcohol dehydrogenase family)
MHTSPLDLTGRTVMVTGANSGIGFETARALAEMGARVWMACRSKERCTDALGRVREAVGRDVDVQATCGDFSELASVRAMAERFLETGEPLHVLVNNAGRIYGKHQVTADGHEMTWQVNLLAPFLLTELLRERLVSSAPSRIVNVTSDAYRSSKKVFWDDLEWQGRRYRGFPAYAHAKLGVVIWTRELNRRLEGAGVTANTVHPGGVRTRFPEEWGGAVAFGWDLIGPLLRSPEKGAETSIWLASALEMEGVSGGHYFDREIREITPAADDEETGERLWGVLLGQAGIA